MGLLDLKNVNVRTAKREDLPKVVQLIMKRGEEFDYEYSGLPEPEIECVTNTVYHNWIKSPCFIVEDDSGIIRVASTNLNKFGWSSKVYMGMFMVYVLPNKRKLVIVKKLYKSVQDYALLQGLLLCDDYIAVDRVDGRKRLMRSLGFKESGFLLTFNGGE